MKQAQEFEGIAQGLRGRRIWAKSQSLSRHWSTTVFLDVCIAHHCLPLVCIAIAIAIAISPSGRRIDWARSLSLCLAIGASLSSSVSASPCHLTQGAKVKFCLCTCLKEFFQQFQVLNYLQVRYS